MKERSSSSNTTTSNNAPASVSSTTATNSTNPSADSDKTDSPQQNFLSPYDSINFMAPPIGAIIKCVTCLGNTVQGKVIAYDHQTKMLALRTAIPSKSGFFDYSMVNVAWCSSLEVIEETTEAPEPPSNLNTHKIEKRKKLNIENKYKEINSLGNDVSSLAQHLYFTISKTLDQVEWEDKNIVVMNSVIIKPPYDAATSYGRNADNVLALEHVKKIVKKFNEEYSKDQASSAQVNQTEASSDNTK